MSDAEMSLKELSVQLFEKKVLKFEMVKTKTGAETPVYFDFRVIVSYPDLLRNFSNLLSSKINDIIREESPELKVNLLCGVPYTAVPITTLVSMKTGIPMIMKRKEANLVDGVYKTGDRCAIVDDVIMFGDSILDIADDLKEKGIKCPYAVVILDREQGSLQELQNKGIKVHSIITLSKLLNYLKEANCVSKEICENIRVYIKTNQAKKEPKLGRLHSSFFDRSKITNNSTAAKLFEIMGSKQTNLCLAANLTKSADILFLAKQVGLYICALKLHIDTVEDFDANFIISLKDIAQKLNFMLIEDRKFDDVGKIVKMQYSQGLYKIFSWADLVTSNCIMGKEVLDSLKGYMGFLDRGVVVVADTREYTQSVIKIALGYTELIAGVICQHYFSQNNPGWIQITELTKTEGHNNIEGNLEDLVLKKGADIVTVGTNVIKSNNPVSTAIRYQKKLWAAYENRINY